MDVTIKTPITELLNIKYPVMSAGMGSVSMHKLVAAVSNAGGIGSLGGVSMSPEFLRKEIRFVKQSLKPGLPFGVDLLVPQIGGSARKTNKDYAKGQLPELIDIIVQEKVSLFISAVGVPPKWAVDKLHDAGIPIMNMCGLPQHVIKALDVGVDIICAQGTEAGGHTGEVSTMVLIPQCVDLVRGRKNFFGKEIPVIAAGGIFDGRGLAAALSLGASGVWVGTRFVASIESSASEYHKNLILNLESKDTIRTLTLTGRPIRLAKTDYVMEWEAQPEKIRELTAQGIVPVEEDVRTGKIDFKQFAELKLLGQACGGIKEIKSAQEIVESMVKEAVAIIRQNQTFVAKL